MSQSWNLVNLDKQYGNPNWRTLGEVFWKTVVNIEWFVRPIIPSTRLWTMTNRLIEIKLRPTTPPLLKLPPELIENIFMELPDLYDMTLLCVAHDILGAVGEYVLYVRVKEIINDIRWAGDRILYLGRRTRDDDYPEAVQGGIARIIEPLVAANRIMMADDGPDNAFWYCFRQFEGKQGLDIHYSISNRLLPYWDPRYTLMLVRPKPWSLYASQQELARVAQSREESMPSGRPYIEQDARRFAAVEQALQEMCTFDGIGSVLCNLSKGEYVRGDAITELKHTDFTDFYYRTDVCLDLGHVLTAYICWSSNSDCGVTKNNDIQGRLTRGRWAGDRFEVTPQDKMSPGIEWRDITDEAVAWLTEIWKAS